MKKDKEGMKSALKALSGMMGEEIGNENKGSIKKPSAIGVKVVADSPKAAVEGLSKAQKIMKAKMEDGGMAKDLKGNKTEDYGKSDYYNKKKK